MLFRKSQVFIWKDPQIQAMKILKLTLITIPALKTINYFKEVGMIIYTINTSDED